MIKRTIALSLVVLAAAASCQRQLEGSPCPCVSGYQCCAAEQACYPESTGCPGALPGALAWKAAGSPTFDQVGNIYVDEENGAHVHEISLLDKQTGKPRWTKTGVSQLRCSTKDAALFVRFPTLGGPTAGFTEMLGVSTADGVQRWSAPVNGITCSPTQDQVYVVDTSTSTDGVIKVYATRDGAVVRSGRIEGPTSGATLVGIRDNLALASWQDGGDSALQALDLPEGREGSVRWTTRLPLGASTSYSFKDAGSILALTGDGATGRALVRLAASDSGVVWRHATSGAHAAMVGGKWPGIVLLTEGEDLVAVGEQTGETLWTFPLTAGEGYDPGRLSVLDSGDVLISYDRPATPSGAASTLHKLLGSDGGVQWAFGPTAGSFHPLDANEYYLLHDGVLSQVDPRTGTYVWSYSFVEGVTDYPRALVGSDREQLFVRVGPRSEADCANSCLQRLLVLERQDGRVAWGTSWFALPPPTYQDFNHVFTDAAHVYVFTPTPGLLRTGAVWAFRR